MKKNQWTVPLLVLIFIMLVSFVFLLEKVQSPASNDIRSRAEEPASDREVQNFPIRRGTGSPGTQPTSVPGTQLPPSRVSGKNPSVSPTPTPTPIPTQKGAPWWCKYAVFRSDWPCIVQ